MKKITYSKLVEHLRAVRGMAIVGLETATDARLLKTDNPFELPVFKHSRLVAHVGADYGLAVNNEALRQDGSPAFEAGALPKGRNWFVPGKVLISDDRSKLYLRTQSTPGKRARQANRILGFTDANGTPVSREIVAKFTPIKKESAKQQDATGIVKTIHVNDYLFTSIRKIRIAGNTYQLIPD